MTWEWERVGYDQKEQAKGKVFIALLKCQNEEPDVIERVETQWIAQVSKMLHTLILSMKTFTVSWTLSHLSTFDQSSSVEAQRRLYLNPVRQKCQINVDCVERVQRTDWWGNRPASIMLHKEQFGIPQICTKYLSKWTWYISPPLAYYSIYISFFFPFSTNYTFSGRLISCFLVITLTQICLFLVFQLKSFFLMLYVFKAINP